MKKTKHIENENENSVMLDIRACLCFVGFHLLSCETWVSSEPSRPRWAEVRACLFLCFHMPSYIPATKQKVYFVS